MQLLFYPLLGAMTLSLLTAPIGCFLVWKRLSFLSDVLGHSALLGVTLSFLIQIPLSMGSIFVCLTLSILIFSHHEKRALIPKDAFLAFLSYTGLSLGFILLHHTIPLSIDPMSFLLGDILLVDLTDVLVCFSLGVLVLFLIITRKKELFLSIMEEGLLQAEAPSHIQKMIKMTLTILLSVSIAYALKMVGILLAPALFILPILSSRYLSSSPLPMIFASIIITTCGSTVGILLSYNYDLITGPCIVLTHSFVFIAILFFSRALRKASA